MLLPRTLEAATRVRAFDTALLVRGPGGSTDRHAHHWWHLVLGLEGPVEARGDEGEGHRAGAVLTPPDVPHAIEVEGPVAIVYVEPTSRIAASLEAARPERTLHVLSTCEVDHLRRELADADNPGDAVIARLLEAFGATPVGPAPRHPGVTRVLQWLDGAPADADRSLETLARMAGLSRSRFMHAFTEQVGLPLRPYVRWLRSRRAAQELLGGRTATEAAHSAGFSDAAHMTRTFREMFGITPTELARRSQSVQLA